MRHLRVALVPAGIALGIGAEWASYEPGGLDSAAADLIAGWALLGCGLVAWKRHGESRTGPLMAAAGVTWFLGSIAPAALYLHRGPLVHLLLAYPSGRLTRRRDRVVVPAAYVAGAIEPLGRSAAVTLVLCAATAVAATDGYLREAGPQRRSRALAAAAATSIGLVLGFGAVARLAG